MSLTVQVDEEKEERSLYNSLSCYKKWLDIRADPAQLTIGERIAVGGFKEVFKGMYAGEPVAVSVLNTSAAIEGNEREARLLSRELRAMNMFSRHPGVPRFYGYCSTSVGNRDDLIVLVSELCEHGDLVRFVARPVFGTMTTRDRMMLCVDILRILSVMHDEEIYHCR